ncbi:hypothetical protein ElyMa_002349600 [Elysia marginata]|uniref:Uncharacterized protein n=1 Tax=Elysia marginata TaxID=1093978 RepID=A0AAV4GA06_9GAST|nr:hypothetical protein ElyMa_002349600 [Elysia marginata]
MPRRCFYRSAPYKVNRFLTGASLYVMSYVGQARKVLQPYQAITELGFAREALTLCQWGGGLWCTLQSNRGSYTILSWGRGPGAVVLANAMTRGGTGKPGAWRIPVMLL